MARAGIKGKCSCQKVNMAGAPAACGAKLSKPSIVHRFVRKTIHKYTPAIPGNTKSANRVRSSHFINADITQKNSVRKSPYSSRELPSHHAGSFNPLGPCQATIDLSFLVQFNGFAIVALQKVPKLLFIINA
jgi:hypothetical protein